MDIAFLTFFLGLVTGPRSVAVSAGPSVAVVELRLDGARVARLTAPPWTATVDFGRELVPHDLEAAAFDAEGKPVGTTRQRVNLPRALAVASIALEGAPGGKRVARITWVCAFATKPSSVRLSWDNEKLTPPDPFRFELPSGDRGGLHVLRAELGFGRNITAVAQTFVGGQGRNFTSAELTSVPVVVTGKKTPEPEALAGWFLRGGKPAAVVAVEEGPADVVFVPDPDAEPALDRLLAEREKSDWGVSVYGAAGLARLAYELPKDVNSFFALPAAIRFDATGYQVFSAVGPFDHSDGGLLYAFRLARTDQPPRDAANLKDVAAMAGTVAVQNGRRRAAVWILSEGRDLSDPAWDVARRYLRTLHVPLFVWRVAKDGSSAKVAPGELDVSSDGKLNKAISQLSKALASQRVVWLDGLFLPQAISLSPSAKGLEIAR